jgi:hypothetical protein
MTASLKHHFTMKYLLVVTSVFITCCQLIAQNTTSYRVHGFVRAVLDQKPVPYASVYIKNYDHIGTATSADGSFELIVPYYAQNDAIVVSSISFERQEVALSTLPSSKSIEFYLKPLTIVLNEVVISEKNYDLEKICMMAIKRIPTNYPLKSHYLDGFYRKISTDSIRFTGLIEARIAILDQGYSMDENKTQIQVLKARHGDNLITWDSMLIKMRSQVKLEFDISQAHSLHRLYESNLIRLYNKQSTFFNQKESIFDSKARKNGITTKVDLDSVFIFERDTIVSINYQWFSPSNQRLDAIRIAININDYSILEFERGFFGEHVHLRFKKQSDGHYYPFFIKRTTPTIYDKSKHKRYYNIEFLEFDQVEINSNRKLKRIELENRTMDFDPQKFKYDSSYWENYHKAYPRPLNRDVLKSLEEIRSLSLQFSRHKN